MEVPFSNGKITLTKEKRYSFIEGRLAWKYFVYCHHVTKNRWGNHITQMIPVDDCPKEGFPSLRKAKISFLINSI
jgi:hypothetical protein